MIQTNILALGLIFLCLSLPTACLRRKSCASGEISSSQGEHHSDEGDHYWIDEEDHCHYCPYNDENCQNCPLSYDPQRSTCDNFRTCNGSDAETCGQCKHFYWLTSGCTQCYYASSQAECELCYSQATLQYNHCVEHMNDKKCEFGTSVLDETTNQCVLCNQTQNATLCQRCRHFSFDNSINSCIPCLSQLSGCEGCTETLENICQNGCPNHFRSNRTHCIPKTLIKVILSLNPSSLLANWDQNDLNTQQTALDTNRQQIKSAILTLMGLSDKPQSVKQIELSVGSIIAEVTVFPNSGEDIAVTQQNIQTEVNKNQAASGLTVLSSSISSESETSQDRQRQSSISYGLIIGIVLGVVCLSIFIVVICVIVKRKQQKSIGPTPIKSESLGQTPDPQFTDKDYQKYSDDKKTGTDPQFDLNHNY